MPCLFLYIPLLCDSMFPTMPINCNLRRGYRMDANKIELERNEYIEYLDSILNAYRSTERKSKKILGFIIVVCVIAAYFMLSDLLGGTWGYILTLAIVLTGAYCVDTLGLFRNNPASDGKLAYQACITMETLIAIKSETYRPDVARILYTGSGTHLDLYNRFIQLYPECASRDLKKLARIHVKREDIFD